MNAADAVNLACVTLVINNVEDLISLTRFTPAVNVADEDWVTSKTSARYIEFSLAMLWSLDTTFCIFVLFLGAVGACHDLVQYALTLGGPLQGVMAIML